MQSIRDTWISITAIRNGNPNKVFEKRSSNGIKYLEIINYKDKTFKMIWIEMLKNFALFIVLPVHRFTKNSASVEAYDSYAWKALFYLEKLITVTIFYH